MKAYYDIEKDNVIIDNIGRYFANGTIEAIQDGTKIKIRYKNTDVNELYVSFDAFLKEDGTPAGENIQETLDYLNIEFSKGLANGEDSFTGSNTTKTINHDLIREGDIIIVSPVSLIPIPDILTVVNTLNGSFTVTRTLLMGILYTSGLSFRWKKI